MAFMLGRRQFACSDFGKKRTLSIQLKFWIIMKTVLVVLT